MPEAAIRRRGGATRVRTIELGNGRYAHVYVVPKAGPRGGHTVMGEPKKKADSKPRYRIKREPLRRRSKGVRD